MGHPGKRSPRIAHNRWYQALDQQYAPKQMSYTWSIAGKKSKQDKDDKKQDRDLPGLCPDEQ
jgi:hypothetical protein